MTKGQFIVCLIIGVTIAVTLFVSQLSKAAPGITENQSTLQCIDFQGNIKTYVGASSNFEWAWDNNYVSVKTQTHMIKYPMGMCILSIPR